jgi:hypothetical protein
MPDAWRLATHGGRAPRFFGNQDGAEVVDIGHRRPVYGGVTERFEEAVAVVAAG